MGDQQQRGEGSKSAHTFRYDKHWKLPPTQSRACSSANTDSSLNGTSSQQPQVLRKHWPNSEYVSAEQFPRMIQGLHPAAHRVWQKHLPPILKALDNVDKAFADPATTKQNTDCSYIATTRSSSRKGSITGIAAAETPACEGQTLDSQGFQHTHYRGILQRQLPNAPGFPEHSNPEHAGRPGHPTDPSNPSHPSHRGHTDRRG
jgi:hypothetical protein